MINYRAFEEAPKTQELCFEYFTRWQRGGHDHHAFFDLWVSFNIWVACVTGLERDAEMIRDIGNDNRLSVAFRELKQRDPHFATQLRRFEPMWPVFKAQDVVQRLGRDFAYRFDNRAAFNAAIIDNAKISRKPTNWVAGQDVRWSDLVSVIYQVRCNLMHGHKSTQSESDRELIDLSRNLLGHFLSETRCYEWR
ncbi:hypothetical protein SAMN05428969_3345 [Devosia sp. YR412]|uniref:hypothetical protein n=1 Tax=Devosia sp. YR412 TaxID=1881030 RepID=UPI0008BBBB4E|nr:hypothetical protein [Devosia sp. YR412]SEQ52133.1 hypothetical protein SAMN05428969_3345 [Devosia sp. YR412]